MTSCPIFKTVVASLLNNWDAIQFAVQHRTGGPQSKEIAEWLIDVTENYFYDNEELEADEVAGFLSTIMDQELNTLVEDGSDLSVSMIGYQFKMS
ncbi:pre-rRNA-processing protein TSR2 homolog [Oratosquilla oratoria]|uniref:pre-rRNA-processing protein TSR2 homolog n=1 Tax=Oratosquilla oratoria TaxID=337810 RepID=UPI003F75B561